MKPKKPKSGPVAPAVAPAADVRADRVGSGIDDDLSALDKALADTGVVGADADEGDAGDDHQGEHQPGDVASVHDCCLSVCGGDLMTA